MADPIPIAAPPVYQKPVVWIEFDLPAATALPVRDSSSEDFSTEKTETATDAASAEDDSAEKVKLTGQEEQIQMVPVEAVQAPQSDSQLKEPAKEQPLVYREEIVVSSGSLAVGLQQDQSSKPDKVTAVIDPVKVADEEPVQIQAVQSEDKVEAPAADDLKVAESAAIVPAVESVAAEPVAEPVPEIVPVVAEPAPVASEPVAAAPVVEAEPAKVAVPEIVPIAEPVAAEPVVAEPVPVAAPAAASGEKSSDCKVEYIVVKDDTPIVASAPEVVATIVEEPKAASARFDSRPNIRNKSKFGLKRRLSQH